MGGKARKPSSLRKSRVQSSGPALAEESLHPWALEKGGEEHQTHPFLPEGEKRAIVLPHGSQKRGEGGLAGTTLQRKKKQRPGL